MRRGDWLEDEQWVMGWNWNEADRMGWNISGLVMRVWIFRAAL
jgi:hypothetical protein